MRGADFFFHFTFKIMPGSLYKHILTAYESAIERVHIEKRHKRNIEHFSTMSNDTKRLNLMSHNGDKFHW